MASHAVSMLGMPGPSEGVQALCMWTSTSRVQKFVISASHTQEMA